MGLFFSDGRGVELEAAAWFPGDARHKSVTEEQRPRVVQFKAKYHREAAAPPLLFLAWALPDATTKNHDLFLRAAPAMGGDVQPDEYLRELLCTVDGSFVEIGQVLFKFLESYDPTFDYDDLLKHRIPRIVNAG